MEPCIRLREALVHFLNNRLRCGSGGSEKCQVLTGRSMSEHDLARELDHTCGRAEAQEVAVRTGRGTLHARYLAERRIPQGGIRETEIGMVEHPSFGRRACTGYAARRSRLRDGGWAMAIRRERLDDLAHASGRQRGDAPAGWNRSGTGDDRATLVKRPPRYKSIQRLIATQRHPMHENHAISDARLGGISHRGPSLYIAGRQSNLAEESVRFSLVMPIFGLIGARFGQSVPVSSIASQPFSADEVIVQNPPLPSRSGRALSFSGVQHVAHSTAQFLQRERLLKKGNALRFDALQDKDIVGVP
jgi:hypothetical protein